MEDDHTEEYDDLEDGEDGEDWLLVEKLQQLREELQKTGYTVKDEPQGEPPYPKKITGMTKDQKIQLFMEWTKFVYDLRHYLIWIRAAKNVCKELTREARAEAIKRINANTRHKNAEARKAAVDQDPEVLFATDRELDFRNSFEAQNERLENARMVRSSLELVTFGTKGANPSGMRRDLPWADPTEDREVPKIRPAGTYRRTKK